MHTIFILALVSAVLFSLADSHLVLIGEPLESNQLTPSQALLRQIKNIAFPILTPSSQYEKLQFFDKAKQIGEAAVLGQGNNGIEVSKGFVSQTVSLTAKVKNPIVAEDIPVLLSSFNVGQQSLNLKNNLKSNLIQREVHGLEIAGAVDNEASEIRFVISIILQTHVLAYLEAIKVKKVEGLRAEYATLLNSPIGAKFDISQLPSNLRRNRYSDVLCETDSRVVLTGNKSFEGDYINANYIEGFDGRKETYIATQGPTDFSKEKHEDTKTDFWRMVWQEKVVTIAMVTTLKQGEIVKCACYWPKDTKQMTLGVFVLDKEEIIGTEKEGLVITRIRITNNDTKTSRIVFHLYFTLWPDHGTPDRAAFLNLIDKMRHYQAEGMKILKTSNPSIGVDSPIVVHCSAGIGRTGVLLTVDIAMRQIDVHETINVKEVIENIRKWRAGGVQKDQYVFCHVAVLDHAKQKGFISQNQFSAVEKWL